MNKVAVYYFRSIKAYKDAEKACKRKLKCGILSSREIKDGHSETASLLDIDKVIEIYNRYGGIKVK